LKRARDSREWYVNEVDGPTPWISEEDLAEDRAELSEWEYMRLHLNRWTAPSDRVARPEDLGACVTLLDWPLARDSRHSYAIGLDIGMVKDRAVAAVCHVEADGNARRLVLDQMQTWQGTERNRVSLSAVEEWVLGASRSYGGARVHYDPYQAEQPAERLSRQGVRTERATFSAGENSKRALLLHQLIRSHTLAIPDDPELIDELANVRLIETSPGVYRLDHDPNRHDDRAIALALAGQALLDHFPGQVTFASPRGLRIPGVREPQLPSIAGRRSGAFGR
jgi:phage FluMu gp28-like protein